MALHGFQNFIATNNTSSSTSHNIASMRIGHTMILDPLPLPAEPQMESSA